MTGKKKLKPKQLQANYHFQPNRNDEIHFSNHTALSSIWK